MLLPSAASSLLLFTIGPKKRQNDLVSVNKLESKDTTVTLRTNILEGHKNMIQEIEKYQIVLYVKLIFGSANPTLF